MEPFFNSKYPILLVGMNKVSDLRLAMAAHGCGIFASLSVFNYYDYRIGKPVYQNLKKDILEFQDKTGSNNLMISTNDKFLFDTEFLEICQLKLFTHLELIVIPTSNSGMNETFSHPIIDKIKSYGIKIIFKISHSYPATSMGDAYTLKGTGGAGSIHDFGETLIETLDRLKLENENVKIIATGGIGTGAQIKELLNHGAIMVGIGTLFAASEESCISIESKRKMIESSSNDISRFDNSGQNALIFKIIEDRYKDDVNNTLSLKRGIKSPEQGHLFAGLGIDNITEILPMKDIVDRLVGEMNVC
jgi:NAD(P)H-dependent flavin oxidoreductase YrpB (nitropropane dioxygenase family)